MDNRIESGAWPHYGGSRRLVRKLVELMPPDTERIVEAFCGSAVFSLNVPWLPRVVNDQNRDIIHLLRVVRDRPLELMRLLDTTPYHRKEFETAVAPLPDDLDSLERARRLFVRYGMARGGGGQQLIGSDWSRSLAETRTGAMGAVAKFRSRVARLDTIAARLAGVQFEAVDFEKLAVYDGERVFWFLDPPWEPETRRAEAAARYEWEFGEADYGRLVGFVRGLKGRVLLIGYDGGVMGDGLGDWRRVDFEITLSAGQGRGKRGVVGWCNWGE